MPEMVLKQLKMVMKIFANLQLKLKGNVNAPTTSSLQLQSEAGILEDQRKANSLNFLKSLMEIIFFILYGLQSWLNFD